MGGGAYEAVFLLLFFRGVVVWLFVVVVVVLFCLFVWFGFSLVGDGGGVGWVVCSLFAGLPSHIMGSHTPPSEETVVLI